MDAPKRVLYVEDNAANFALVKKVLESEGDFSVEGVESGEDGLQRLQEQRPDLLLLDLDLPGIGGLELARRVQAAPDLAGLPMIAISASVMKRERTEALTAGCVAFVEKPFDINKLREIVRNALATNPAS